MVKVCLSLALAIVFAFSISAQTNEHLSDHQLAVSEVKKDQDLTGDNKTSPTPERPAVAEIQKPAETQTKAGTEIKKTAETQTEPAVSADEKTINGSEIKKAPSISVKDMQPVSQSLLKETKTIRAYSTGNQQIDRYITQSCEKYGVDPLLIFAQMKQESSFKRGATSHKGASGLMQLMPDTAKRFGVRNIYNPKQNIDAGVKYMSWLLNTFGGDVSLALAGYNAGEGAVMKYGNQIPPYRETRTYVKRITAHYEELSASMEAPIAVIEPGNQ